MSRHTRTRFSRELFYLKKDKCRVCVYEVLNNVIESLEADEDVCGHSISSISIYVAGSNM